MKVTYLVSGIILVGGLIFYLAYYNKKQRQNKGIQSPIQTSEKNGVDKQSDNIYADLRHLALSTTPDQLQITLPKNKLHVFGVVMDWDIGEGIATFSSYETGDASEYFTTGGGMIGGIGHENVSNAAKSFVSMSQNYLEGASKTDTTPLPDRNCVRFYFLTSGGTFTAQENLANFENGTSLCLPLFEEANKVITEISIVQNRLQRE